MQDLFADIRPHTDAEVPAVLAQLLDSKVLQLALLRYRFPKCPKLLTGMLLPWARFSLRKQMGKIDNVKDFQVWLVRWIERMLVRTTTEVEVRGLEHLEKGKAYLWISNHRDIAMDPILVNYSLHQSLWPTGQIAIGDNLLKQPEVAALMRLNKSFIVKRNISNRREKMRELQRLSAYIRSTIAQGESVWLAQREGRAKDGIDATDTAVLKMLALAGREAGEDFSQALAQLNPVPVCVQYEWDPCDIAKAKELTARAELGHYAKAQDEDTKSILLGLVGFKGRTLVSFGKPLTQAELASADSMAKAVDEQIHTMSRVSPVQRTALALLQKDHAEFRHWSLAASDEQAELAFAKRLDGLENSVRRRLLHTYAQALLSPENSKAH